ncbi:MAG: amidohydrolase family protein [Bacteroidia bacterium]|nr:MAG: amidohydrolase family protein [Bacteroidia bacterium]
MKLIKSITFLLAAFLFLNSYSQPAGKTVLLKNARLIDGNGGKPVENVSILIINGRFETITTGIMEVPQGTEIIDLEGRTALPGFIDAHFHMNYPNFRDKPLLLNEAISAYRSVPFLYNHLMGGITTLLDAGAYHNVSLMARKAWEDGYISGSRPVVVGERINGTGGHGVSRFDMAVEADGPNEFRKAVRKQLYDGADLVKILPPYSREELAAAIEETHLHQKKVAVHSGIYNKQYTFVRWAAELGCDIIMHAYALPDDVIEMMGEKGIYSVPTMTIMMKNQLGPDFRKDNVELHEYETIFRKLKDAGVKMAVGTDALYEYMNENPGLYFDEVERFVKNGYSEMDAIIAATKIGSEVLDIAGRLGTVEEGKIADIVIVDGDPLQDIKTLRNVKMVIQSGKIVRNEL